MDTTKREQQRVEHLVLGRPRPKVIARKGRRTKRARIALEPGIEEQVALREAWSHKAQGTPQTHEHAHQAGLREGSLARLHRTGTIDTHQLAAAEQIQSIHAQIVRDVTVKTASLETRIDAGRRGGGAAEESFGAIARERKYTDWRAELGSDASIVLQMIVQDVGIKRAARDAGMHERRTKRMLIAALSLWIYGHRALA